MTDVYTLIVKTVLENIKLFKSRAESQGVLKIEGFKFFRVGNGAFRNVYAVWVGEELQDFVIKINRTKFNSNGFEYQNYLMFKEVGLDCHLVPCLHFENDILFMEKVNVCQDFLGSRNAAHHILNDIKSVFSFDSKNMKKYKNLSDGLDIRKANMSDNFLVLDYGIPLIRVN